MPNPKFDKHIKEKISQARAEESANRYGIVMSYDRMSNTATVLLSAPESDGTGDLVRGVLCPVYPGIQMAAPEPGRPCWVVFKDRKGEKFPMISHYFNHNYQKFDYAKQNRHFIGLPRFYTAM